MKKLKYIGIGSMCLLLLAASMNISFTNVENDDCMEKVRAIYAKMLNASYDPKSTQTYYVDYSVQVVSRDNSGGEPKESRIQMWIQGGYIRILSNEMEVYQDNKEVFTVMHQHKTLVRSDRMMGMKDDYKKQKMAIFQDTLFSLSEVAYCVPLSLKPDAVKRISLRLNKEGQKLLKIKAVVFDINEKLGQLKKVRIDFTDDHKSARSPLNPIAYTVYIINSFDPDSDENIEGESVANLFLHRNGTPLLKYRDYEFMDVRYKSNKSILK